MRRFGALLLLTIALLAGCGGRESPVSPDEAPETALTEQDVRNMYTAASTVYDWFDLTTLPLDRADSRTEGDLTYYRVDAENLSLPVSTVAEPTDSTLSWQPQPVTITSLADLQETAESYFSPEIVDNLFALSPDHAIEYDESVCNASYKAGLPIEEAPPTGAEGATCTCWTRPWRRSRWMKTTGP